MTVLRLASLLVALQFAHAAALLDAASPVFHQQPDSAYAAAREQGGEVLMIFSADWCGPCRQLHRDLHALPEPTTMLGAVQVCTIDVERQQNVAAPYQIRALPTIIVVTPDRVILDRSRGYQGVAALVERLQAARQKRRRGLWAGMSPTALPEEPAALLAMAAGRDPWQRLQADEALVSAAHRAMPSLIAGLRDDYLGTRIAADRVLRRLTEAAPAQDPWAPVAARHEAAANMAEWWSAGGELVPRSAIAADPRLQERIGSAIDQCFATDAPTRTTGLNGLLACGHGALPHIHAARQLAERNARPAVARILEDVRWALLIDQRMAGEGDLRWRLSRGDPEQRRSAAKELGGLGASALPALRELLSESDPLLREVSLHALRSVGGEQAVAAMSGMLQAEDANLRMVAAQQLGKSKQAIAAPALGAALDDDDEMVVATAIAALRELKATNQVPALIAVLDDRRWRVRSAAAEALGDLEAKDAASITRLQALLDDDDAFVARSALLALKELDQTVGVERLRELAVRHSDLLSTIAKVAGDQKQLPLVHELFASAEPQHRAGMLQAMIKSYNRVRDAEEQWTQLLVAGANDAHPPVRLATIDLLRQRASHHGRRHCLALLEDQEAAVRVAARELCVYLLQVHSGLGGGDDPAKGVWQKDGMRERVDEVYRRWLAALPDDEPLARLLRFVLASRVDPPTVPPARLVDDLRTVGDGPHHEETVSALRSLVVAVLPLPAAEQTVDRLLADGDGAATLMASAMRRDELAAMLLEPARCELLVATLGSCSDSAFARIADQLLENRSHPLWLPGEAPAQTALRQGLLDHQQARPRALGIFALARSNPYPVDRMRGFALDDSPLVRAQVALGLCLAPLDRERHRLACELVEDPDPTVARNAAAALLTTVSAKGIDLDDHWRRFRFADESVYIRDKGHHRAYPRPMTLDDGLRYRLFERLQQTDDQDLRLALVMLLLDADDDRIGKHIGDLLPAAALSPAVTVRLALTEGLADHYQPRAEQLIRGYDVSYRLRQLLVFMQSDFSPAARRLRRLINQRLRELD